MSAAVRRPGWSYYFALVLFIAILAFAVLGLVRSSTVVRVVADAPEGATTPPSAVRTGPVPTAQIPPPTPSAPTPPPSRTYLHPPPELGATAEQGEAVQPRR